MKKLNILFCSNTFSHIHHGPAKFANLILDLNERDDISITILTEDVESDQEHVIKAQMKWTHRFPPVKMLCKIIDYYQNIVKIRQTHQFDVIVFNHALVGLLTAMRVKDIPVVGMINDDNSSSLSLFRPQLNKGWIRYFILRQFEKLATKYLDRIIVNSDFLQEALVESYSLKRDQLPRLYKGISFAGINQQLAYRTINKDATITVLFVKSDYERGGLFQLIEALKLLNEFRFRLIVIGPPEAARDRIITLSSDSLQIDFRSKQPQKIVYQLLAEEADVFCVPSVKEGLGVANMEALAHKVTVVGTRVGGIPEVLDFGKCGWLCEPDENAIAQAIKAAIINEEENNRKRKYGFDFCLNHFNQSNLLANFTRILENTVRAE